MRIILKLTRIIQRALNSERLSNIWFSHVFENNDSENADYVKIEFELNVNDNCQSVLKVFQFDLLQSCHATTKCINWQNSIDKESIQIIFDKRIVIERDTIIAGENILSNETINSATDILIVDDCNTKLIKITISSEIGKMINFEIGIYEIVFKCSTSHNRLRRHSASA